MSAALTHVDRRGKLFGAATLLVLAGIAWGVVQCRKWQDQTLGSRG